MHHLKVTDSSSVGWIGYDPIERQLEVRFKGTPNALYRYKNVDSRAYLELLAAKSVGSYFDHRIKKHPAEYPFERIDVPEPATGLSLGESFKIAADLRLACDALEAAVAALRARGASDAEVAPFIAVQREVRR